jgi:hypothetical protein
MYAIRKFAGRTGGIGTALPDPFGMMGQSRVKFRLGGTSMIAGAPGSFKSVFALNLLTKWAETNSILYFSFDSDEFTVAKRLSAILTDDDTDTVERDLTRNGRYTAALARVNSASFVYRNFDLSGIEHHLGAFEAVHGAYPDIVFVDNLINTVDDPTDWGGMINVTKQLDILARETRSHVCVLHHASESWAQYNPGMPPPSWAIQGKVNQIPRLVLTLACQGNLLRVACTKNTNGPQSPNASDYMSFTVQPSLRVDPFEYTGASQYQGAKETVPHL